MFVYRGPCPTGPFSDHVVAMLLSRCSDQLLGSIQAPFSLLALTVIISQTEEMVSANEFATFHSALCHSSISQNLLSRGKKKEKERV